MILSSRTGKINGGKDQISGWKVRNYVMIMIRMMCVCANLVQSCLTLCDPMDCSLPGSSVHGSFQARILGWVVMSSSRGSSWSRDWNCVSCYPALQADSILLSHLGSPIRIMTFPQNISSPGYSPKYIYIERQTGSPFSSFCLNLIQM